ncbi:MAG: phage tail tape measure protein [Flavobacterium sp. MedPE-SWcel]|uniref:phage tail tape measure protein n=1 Tax=uncultured Flavobacterium sp. TaxID=165435 RepID=UPI00092368B6|nr:phage tail tape measure protein [uncultured Flavobacterium sp.]OIQ22204.1 MAG: phage tail tape measure protein [Flavobacterium sp. MedPE-SWcel]
MANKGGVITRKDIIEDDALRFGEVYAKNLEKAISSNEVLVASVKELNKQAKAFKVANGHKEYITIKQATTLATQKAIDAIKIEEAAELSADKIKRSHIATINAEKRAKQQVIKLSLEEKVINQQATTEAKRQIIANGALANAYKELSAKVAIAGDKVKNIIATGRKAGETQAQYNKRLKQAQAHFDKLSIRVRAADAAVGQFNRNVGNYPKQATAALKNLISAFGVTTGIYLFAQVMKDAFNVARDFEKQNATLSAVLQVEKENMKALTDEAKKLGARTVKSAGEVTQLQIAYARLGFSQQEIIDLTESTISGSIAMNSELAQTADLVGAVVNTFDDFSSTDAPEIIDVMSLATAKSALNFQKLETGIPIVAGAANAAGVPFTKLVALLGKLADSGIDTSSSATALRNIFIESAAQGLDYGQILQKIKDSQDKLTAANDEFGKRAAVSSAVLAENIDKTNELDEALRNAAGTAQNMADKELATLDGAVKLLSSAWDGLIIDTTDANSVNSKLAVGLTFLAENLKTIFNVLGYLTAAWVAYKTSLVLANVQTKLIALATTQSTAAQAGNATATNLSTIAWKKFNTALKANALMLSVTALIAIVYYFNKLHKSLEELTDEAKSSTEAFLQNKEQTQKNISSISTLADRYDVLKSKTELTKEEQKELNKITKELGKTVPEATEKVNGYGDALEINTEKIRAYNKEQKEHLALGKSIELKIQNDLLKQQRERLEDINQANIEASKIYDPKFQGFVLEGAGSHAKTIKTLNGELQIRNGIYGKYRDLTDEELHQYQEIKMKAEEEIQNTNKRVEQIKEVIDLTKESTSVNEDAEGNSQKAVERTIAIIDEEIKIQKEKIATLSDKTGKKGDAIKAEIASLEAERELIYRTQKAEKKRFDNGIKGYKEVREAIYQLSQFRYDNEIKINEEIIKSDSRVTEEKLKAQNRISELREAKNEETLRYELEKNALEKEGVDKLSKSKLEAYKKDVENRIESLVSGKIKAENISNEELLIIEKYYAQKRELQEKDKERTQEIIDSEVEAIRKRIDAELQLRENNLNQDIVKENDVYNEELNSAQGNFSLIEKAREDHEKRLFDIKKKYALEGLNLQIDELQTMLDKNDSLDKSEQISSDKRAQIVADLERFKREASDLKTESYVSNLLSKEEKEKLFAAKIKELTSEMTGALTDFTNTIFDGRAERIDEDIARSDEHYAHQIELAGNDQEQKDLYAEEAEKKRKELEAKKRKEQQKQAVFNKAMQATQVGISTIGAVMSALRDVPKFDFGISAAALAATYAGIGAVQLAAVLAKPIPKYKDGRKGGKEEIAFVGDGGVNEVIERASGAVEITPAQDTLVKLNAGDKVHSSIEEYNKLQRAAMATSLNLQGKNVTDYQAQREFDDLYGKELLEELKENTRAVKRNRTVVNYSKIDLEHEFWKMGNKNWE